MFGSAVPGDRHPQRMVLETSMIRKPHWQMPVWLWLAKQIGKGMVALIGWLLGVYLRFWRATLPATGFGVVFWRYGWIWGTATMLATATVLMLWWWRLRGSFWRCLGWFYVAQWRRWTAYRRDWYPVCANLALAMSFAGDRFFPTVVKVRRDAEGDLVTVRMLPGQHPNDWAKHAARFAYAFNVQSCTVRSAAGRRARNRVVLHMQVRDSLSATIAPLATPTVPDLNALPVAVRSGGGTVSISMLTHVLIAGASGAGKGSVLWAILSALAAAIRAGLVRVYAFDPKGGVELADGAPLFHRFHFQDPATMADALEDLTAVMRRRQDTLRGRGRVHVASVAEPTIVIVIDEFATLTAHVGDRKLKDRINMAMSLLLTQGRAVGVHVIAALQDPRKEILPFRNLFGTRIALRLNEESEANLALADDAVDRGAACHLIPKSLPGVGYMVLEEYPEPVRLRFPFHTDADIKALAQQWRPAINSTPVVDGTVLDINGTVVPTQPTKPIYEVNR